MAIAHVQNCTTGETTEINVPDPTSEQRKAVMLRTVDNRRDACFLAGFTPGAGPLAGKTLQARNVRDRTNWLVSKAEYQGEVDAGNGSAREACFRTADNELFVLSYAEGNHTLALMAKWEKAVMARSWTLKNAVGAATDLSELDAVAIDIEAGWP